MIMRRGADGLISLPNENPYWEHYRHSTAFQHSQNRYDNKFTGEEKIYLYAGLNSEYASPMPNLTTGANFIDIFLCGFGGKARRAYHKSKQWRFR